MYAAPCRLRGLARARADSIRPAWARRRECVAVSLCAALRSHVQFQGFKVYMQYCSNRSLAGKQLVALTQTAPDVRKLLEVCALCARRARRDRIPDSAERTTLIVDVPGRAPAFRPCLTMRVQHLTNDVAETRHLTIESYLIKPVQRICKYPLLIKVAVRLVFMRCGPPLHVRDRVATHPWGASSDCAWHTGGMRGAHPPPHRKSSRTRPRPARTYRSCKARTS